jgi:hypothetical protein
MPSAAQEVDNASYFPLKIGNTWLYSNPDYLFLAQVYDSVRVNQQLYHVYNLQGADTLRVDAEGKVRRLNNGTETVIIDFTLSEGSWNTGRGKVSVNRSATIETPAGSFRQSIRFSYLDSGTAWAYAPFVGMVQHTIDSFPPYYNLEFFRSEKATSQVDPTEFFPLGVGSVWTHQENFTDRLIRSEITATFLRGQVEYSILSNGGLLSDQVSVDLMRVDASGKVWVVDGAQEVMLWDFGAEEMTLLNLPNPAALSEQTKSLILKGVEWESALGTQTDCAIVSYPELNRYMVFCPGYGLIRDQLLSEPTRRLVDFELTEVEPEPEFPLDVESDESFAYPNPAAGSTTIVMSVGSPSDAVSLFDSSGRLVAKVSSTHSEESRCAFVWDSTAVSAGVYHALIEGSLGRSIPIVVSN